MTFGDKLLAWAKAVKEVEAVDEDDAALDIAVEWMLKMRKEALDALFTSDADYLVCACLDAYVLEKIAEHLRKVGH